MVPVEAHELAFGSGIGRVAPVSLSERTDACFQLYLGAALKPCLEFCRAIVL